MDGLGSENRHGKYKRNLDSRSKASFLKLCMVNDLQH